MRPSRIVLTFVFIAGLCVASVGAAHSQATDAPAPAPALTNPPLPSPKPTAEDPRIRKLAVQQFLAWQTAEIDRDLYSDRVNGELTDELMDKGTKTLANLGALQHATFLGISAAKSANLYVYKMACENGAIQMEFALDTAGKIDLIFFE